MASRGWGLLHQTIRQQLQYLASPHQVVTGCVRFHLGGGGGRMKFLAFSYLLLQFTMILAQNYIYMHDVAKLKLANSKSQSYIGCHSLTDRCDFTTEKMVGGTLSPLLSFAPPPLVNSHGPERKQSYFSCKLTVKCKLEKATNRCSPPSGSAKGGVSICYMSIIMNIWHFTWRLAGGSTPHSHPLYGTFMSQLSTTEVRHRAYIHFVFPP